MVSATMVLHQHADGEYRLHVSVHEDGRPIRVLLDESSHPMLEVLLSDAWTVAAQMAQDALRAVEPSAGLWAAASWSRTD